MKKLPVEMSELILALEDASWMADYFLDTETGQVVRIADETRRQLEDLYEEAYELDPESSPELTALLEDSDLPDWQKETLLEAGQVKTGYGRRYIVVPKADSHSSYEDMEDFILTVKGERLQDRLWRAIQGRGAFRRFKDVLAAHPAERERWFAFKDRRLEEQALDWLASKGIEPIRGPGRRSNCGQK